MYHYLDGINEAVKEHNREVDRWQNAVMAEAKAVMVEANATYKLAMRKAMADWSTRLTLLKEAEGRDICLRSPKSTELCAGECDRGIEDCNESIDMLEREQSKTERQLQYVKSELHSCKNMRELFLTQKQVLEEQKKAERVAKKAERVAKNFMAERVVKIRENRKKVDPVKKYDPVKEVEKSVISH